MALPQCIRPRITEGMCVKPKLGDSVDAGDSMKKTSIKEGIEFDPSRIRLATSGFAYGHGHDHKIELALVPNWP